MRIIAGSARRMRLEGDAGSARATLERVKENYFNALHFDLPGSRVLDLFAGSGQLGLEALSRGAAEAVFVDISAKCVELAKVNAKRCGLDKKCLFYNYDYAQFINMQKKGGGSDKFDFVFLDPPYEGDALKNAAGRILSAGLLAEGGRLVCESDRPCGAAELELGEGYESKNFRYGTVFISIIRKGEG